MKFIRFWSFSLIVFLLSPYLTFASHIIGGDITYKCLGNNNFEFTITFYQDCMDGEPEAIIQDNPAFYAFYTAGNQSELVKTGHVQSFNKTRVDPNFSNDCIDNFPNTCMQKQVFKFTTNLAPHPDGYYIVSQRCCRNGSITNISNPGNTGISYFAKIPGWSGATCNNSSPTSDKVPPQIICVNENFIYDFSATDPNGDSLSYSLCQAKVGGSPINPKPNGSEITAPPYASVNYIPPYSATNPVMGSPGFSIHPETGILTGKPIIPGRFIVTICISEWRNDSLIAEYTRDYQFVITNCSKAVIADIPDLSDSIGVHQIVCDDYTVKFKNDSKGGFEYLWDFGVNSATSNQYEPSFTYPDTGKYTVRLVVNPNSTCADSIEKEVWIYPEFSTDFDWDGSLCPGEIMQFNDQSETTYGDINYWHWTFADEGISNEENPQFIFDFPGGRKSIKLVSANSFGCIDSMVKKVDVAYLDVFAGNDTTIVLGYDFSLKGIGADTYEWIPHDYLSNPYISNPKVDFPATGSYQYVLHGQSGNNCKASDTINILVVDHGTVFVPNAFSPNDDGFNDIFRPEIIGYAIIKYFKVYNRYGEIVYYAHNDNRPGWNGRYANGKKADLGTYFWEIAVINPKGEEEAYSGDVILLR